MNTQTDRFRLFLSLIPPHDWTNVLTKWQQQLDKSLPPNSIRWVKPEMLHLTLQFYGWVSADRVSHLIDTIIQYCPKKNHFTLHLGGMDAFPSLNRPEILWAGLQGDIDQLQLLYQQIVPQTSSFIEKPQSGNYHPHITLGRVKRPISSSVRQKISNSPTVSQLNPWIVQKLHLMQSAPAVEGCIHTILYTFPMEG